MRREVVVISVLFLFILGFSSCKSGYYAKKCNGKKGVKTNMGIL